MIKMNETIKMFIDDDCYIGTIIDVSLNKARFKLNSSIKNSYSMANDAVMSLGRVNDYCLIYNVGYIILCKINYITTVFTDKASKNNIELKINSVNKYEIDTIGDIKYLGSISFKNKKMEFKNGIKVYPQIADRVFMITEDLIKQVLWGESNKEDNDDACLIFAEDFHFKKKIEVPAGMIFNKHCAILGSSGSGKSNTVAKIIEEFLEHTDNTKKMILIDPTGEYAGFDENVNLVEGLTNKFYIHKQHITFNDLCFYLNPSSQIQMPVLMLAYKSWQNYLNGSNELSSQVENYSKENDNKKFKENACATLVSRIESLANTEGMEWLTKDWGNKNKDAEGYWDDICEKLDYFLGDENKDKKLLRIDLSLFTAKHQSKEFFINFICNYILNKQKKDYKKEKDDSSVILCVDEAHNFLNKKMKYLDAEEKLDSIEIVAKEGRKYGLNLMIATQRAKDIPEDVLSQIGFIISHKLSNEGDLNLIKNAISYIDETIMLAVPMLPTGHAFLLCSELKLPVQVKIIQSKTPPKSESKKWRKKEQKRQ
jgi:uncharacterized protein